MIIKPFGKIKSIEMQNNNIREVEMSVEYKRGSFYSHTNILVTISSSGEENKKKTTWQFNSVLLKIEHALRVSGRSLKWKKWAPTHSLIEQFQKCLWQKSLVLPPPISYVNEIGRAHLAYEETMSGRHDGRQSATCCESALWVASSEQLSFPLWIHNSPWIQISDS